MNDIIIILGVKKNFIYLSFEIKVLIFFYIFIERLLIDFKKCL